MIMRQFLFLVAAIFVLAGKADAHAFLLKSDPTVGATVSTQKTLRLEFSEGVELSLSGVDVVNGSGGVVPIQNTHFNGSDRKVLVTDLPPLPPGPYRVKWHVVSVDSHRTEGDFSFTVKP
jgi:copper resistance protein C